MEMRVIDGAVVPTSKPMSFDGRQAAGRARQAGALRIVVTHKLAEVEPLWRAFEAGGIESPGQSFDFINLWVQTQHIAEENQLYIYAEHDGAPVTLLPLNRRRIFGLRVLTWFPGAHVGCNAPLIDTRRLAAMAPAERKDLWQAMRAAAGGGDLVYLKAVPQHVVDGQDVFAELGQSVMVDQLYRAKFASWQEADKQRSKSRRKHDRQQADRLASFGQVDFEEVEAGETAAQVLKVMFEQRAARFRKMGVKDPFAAPEIRRFYDLTARQGKAINLKLHVLKINGEIVSVRYNIARGDRLFCLISSMTDDAAIQSGSPGRQCLLRIMQTVFAEGYRLFDLGSGVNDEKRLWCNVQIPVSQHYLPLTPRGAVVAMVHRTWQVWRRRIKSDPRLLKLAKGLRALLTRLRGQRGPALD